MKARKKPIIIECFKYDGDFKYQDGSYYVPDWAVGALGHKVNNLYFDSGELFIDTLEGQMHVSVGDYIIKGVNGELYPCKSDIFEKSYDIIE